MDILGTMMAQQAGGRCKDDDHHAHGGGYLNGRLTQVHEKRYENDPPSDAEKAG
jgi:hypothetical protein